MNLFPEYGLLDLDQSEMEKHIQEWSGNERIISTTILNCNA
ncbi:hypothetical protein J2X69_004724 [Algoriphagus sp. 4150]|nr:hypothetical protein [Algoriphagus sp. 4150]